MATNKTQDYKELNRELDEVMARLQSDDISIDEAVTAYERGMELLTEIEAHLKTAENKVTKIKASFEAK